MDAGKGKILAIAVKAAPSSKKSEGDKADEGDDEDEEKDSEGFDSAFADFMSAMKDGDEKKAKKAFRLAIEMCGEDY